MAAPNNGRAEMMPRIVDRLCDSGEYDMLAHRPGSDVPMPSAEILGSVVDRLRGVIFPGFYGPSDVRPETRKFHIGATLDSVMTDLSEQILRGFCFVCETTDPDACNDCSGRARQVADRFLESLPRVRDLLNSDVMAAYEGDPAATRPGEAIYCYPSIRALTNYRLAHELHLLGVPLIPRIITEIAHSQTGIDIHPGAAIGQRFFMDHGTGIVIGETAIIGRNVRIYQGVTLGAKSFAVDAGGNPVKGIPRHPIVEDDVIIYSGATILGRVTIGRAAVIGGNIWLTRDVAPGTRILQGRPVESRFENGGGI